MPLKIRRKQQASGLKVSLPLTHSVPLGRKDGGSGREKAEERQWGRRASDEGGQKEEESLSL